MVACDISLRIQFNAVSDGEAANTSLRIHSSKRAKEHLKCSGPQRTYNATPCACVCVCVLASGMFICALVGRMGNP